MQYDLTIIGGGPAGCAAGVYASRKKLKTLLIAESFGGQSIVSEGIENWIGSVKISGLDLARNLEEHVKAYAGETLEIKNNARVEKIQKENERFLVNTSNGDFQTKAVLIASGSRRRKLNVPGADQYEHKGITYCTSCDGPVFSGQDVIVIGGGNSGFESASQLLAYCKSVTLLHKHPTFKADPKTIEKVLANPNMKAIPNVEIVEVKGDKFVNTLVYKNKETGETVELPTAGIFVETGATPNTEYAKDLVDMTEGGYVKIDPRTQKTSTPMVWAAGDCTDGLYHQNNIAVGDAVRALEDIYVTLKAK
jgi:alkyl hydroperoxide reductase subunit F